jgi:hypothetical protein
MQHMEVLLEAAHSPKRIKLLEAQPHHDHALCAAKRQVSMHTASLTHFRSRIELLPIKLVPHDREKYVPCLLEPKGKNCG